MLLLVDIAEEIAKQRKAAGLSRAELAKRALVSRSTLEALENGRSRRAWLREGQQDSDGAWSGIKASGDELLPPYP